MPIDNSPRIVLSAVDRTSAAFQSAKRNILGLKQSAAGIGAAIGPLLGTVGLLGSALSLLNFKSIVNGIDALNDLKDATGASIENISALEDVAARTGTSFETVGTALVKFNAQLKEAKPGSGPAEVLKAIGLNAQELKRIDPAEALRQTAVALAAYADDGNKARITQELFGKSVRDVAPLLNDLATQGKLNATVTTAQAEAAEKFNQQISALEKNIKDAAREIAGPMVTALNTLFAALDGSEREFKEISAAAEAFLVPLQALTVLGANVAFVFKGLGREIGAIAAQGTALASGNLAAVGVIRDEVIADGKRARSDLDDLEKRVLRIRDANKPQGGRPANEGGGKFIGVRAPDIPGKAETAGLDKARAEALANLRKVTEGRVKAIADGLENERDEIRFGEQLARTLYGQGLQSLEKFYAEQDKARQDNLAAVRKATADTIAARQEELNSPLLKGKDKQSERQEVQNQIDEARAKLRAAEREAEQQGRLSTIERQAEVQAVSDGVRQLEAQIKALQGDTASGALFDIERQVREAAAELRKGGATDEQAAKRAADLGTLLEAQRQLNIARDNFGTFTRRAADEEERFLIAANARGDTQAETEQGLYAIRQQALQQLAEMVRKQDELARSAGPDSPAVQFARELRLEFERLNASVDPALQRMRAVGDEVAESLGKAAGAISLNFKDAKSAVKSLGDSLLAISTRVLVEKPLTDLFRKQIRGLTEGGGGLAGVFGGIFGVGGQASPGGQGNLGNSIGLPPGVLNLSGPAEGGLSLEGIFGPLDPVQSGLKALTGAATGSADVLGSLPQLAGIPATVALGNLSTAAQIAAQNLLAIGGAKAGGGSASSGLFGSLGASITGGAGSSGNLDFIGDSFIKLFGLSRGGYTGPGGEGEPAGVVHGQEFVFSAPAVRKLGVSALQKLHSAAKTGAPALPGYRDGGYVGMSAPTADAPRAARGGDTYSIDMRGITVQSNGHMDRMGEERAAQRIVRTAERYMSRRSA